MVGAITGDNRIDFIDGAAEKIMLAANFFGGSDNIAGALAAFDHHFIDGGFLQD